MKIMFLQVCNVSRYKLEADVMLIEACSNTQSFENILETFKEKTVSIFFLF